MDPKRRSFFIAIAFFMSFFFADCGFYGGRDRPFHEKRDGPGKGGASALWSPAKSAAATG
jgi:hypothetical protein